MDLLVVDQQGRVLLSCPNDYHTDIGRHVPGSCIRFREIIEEALQRCAKSAFSTTIIHFTEPIKVYEFHWNTYRSHVIDQRERTHFITLVYACKLAGAYAFDKHNLPKGEPGHLEWFNTMSEDILPIQRCYKNDWEQLKTRIMEEYKDGME